VHRTTDGGHSWTVISPDLTTNDKSKQQKTGGLTPDDASPTYAATLFAIAESPVEEGLIWTGSNDGLVQITRDGGASWTNVTGNIPDLPPWGTVSNIEPSRYDAGTAYISVDFHQVNNTDPYAYKTADYGNSWRLISGGIPKSVFSYVHVVREDPVRPGLLYLGTENSLFVSFNDGDDWVPLQTNLPHAPVHWLTIQEHFNDLVVATYGRGFWILDDITPLQQLNDEVLASGAYLFAPRPGYRFRYRSSAVSQPGDPGAGENPRNAATIHYYLSGETDERVRISILDGSGQVVRNISAGSAAPGINRTYWDFHLTPSRTPRMRTPVLEHSHVPIGDDGWRPAGESGRVSPLAPPGEYTVRLTVGERELTQQLTVLKDPNSFGTEADIREQFAVILELRDNANAAVDLINEAESVRDQVLRLMERVRGRDAGAEIIAAGNELNQKLIDLEMKLTDLRMSGGSAGQDRLRWPRRLYAKITSLAGYIGGSDHVPTSQHLEVHERLKGLLREYQAQMQVIREQDIAAFNRMLTERGLAGVIAGGSR
jgi:hypothetical protein